MQDLRTLICVPLLPMYQPHLVVHCLWCDLNHVTMMTWGYFHLVDLQLTPDVCDPCHLHVGHVPVELNSFVVNYQQVDE